MSIELGLDIDDTITCHYQFFSVMSKAVRASGGQVHIITSRSATPEVEAITRSELKEQQIEFDELFFLPAKPPEAAGYPAELDWYQAYIFQKVDYCVRNGITVYVDDEAKVIRLFQKYAPHVQVLQCIRKPLGETQSV